MCAEEGFIRSRLHAQSTRTLHTCQAVAVLEPSQSPPSPGQVLPVSQETVLWGEGCLLLWGIEHLEEWIDYMSL